MWVTPSEVPTVMLRDAQRALQPPKQPYALTCARPIWAQNYLVHYVLTPFLMQMLSNDVENGHIHLGLQTPFKSIVLLSCHAKNWYP